MVDHWSWIDRLGLLPPVCLLCGAHGLRGLDLCPGCRAELPALGPHCARCGEPLPAAAAPGPCGACRRKAPAYDRLRAPFRYAPPLDWLIPRLKFQARLAHARLLGALLAEHLLADLAVRPDLIVPVPLHPARLRERGFNQALELARPLARRLGVPLDWRAARRIKATSPQIDLPARARRANVRAAFAAARSLEGLRVAVVDDVATTGATLDALARALKRAGALEVECWVVARAGGA